MRKGGEIVPDKTEVNKQKKRKALMIAVVCVTIAVVFSVAAYFSVLIMRTYRGVAAETTEPQYRYGDIYYSSLTYRLQYLYDSMIEAAEKCAGTTDVIPYYYTEQEFERVIEYIKADRSEMFWLDVDASALEYDRRKCRVTLGYNAEAGEIDAMRTQLEAAVSDIASGAEKASADGDISEILLCLHDHLVRTCSVSSDNSDPLSGTAYGALVGGSASSDGYAAAFRLLCDKLGIYCLSVYGRVYSTDHMWNLIWDGEAYRHIDVMWDDPDLVYIPELVSHAYFALSDEEIQRDHVILRDAIIPDAVSPSDYYSSRSLIVDEHNAARRISLLIDDCIRNGAAVFEFGSTIGEEKLEKLITSAVDEREELSGHRIYRLTENGDVFALQLYYAK